MMCCSILAVFFAAASTVDAIERDLAGRDAAIDAEWRAVASKSAFETKRDEFKRDFRRAVGFDGIIRTPLGARTVETKGYGAFRVEKVLIEGAPGAFIPLLVFLPDPVRFSPPYAGFVFIPGHSDNGKAAQSYLRTCELAARNGLASVIYDPLGQGERSQGAGLKNVQEHVRIGEYATLLGETTATYMVRDASRVLDYLAERPDVDNERLGVCGQSGGGTICAFVMVAEDRIKASVPTCYLSSVREHLLACGPQDAEQNFFGGWRWGFNHASLVLSAGCPVLINASVNDFFQIEGSRSTCRLVKEVAVKVGLPDGWYGLAENPGPHSMSKTHRERAVRFLLKHLNGSDMDVAETETTDFSAADSVVTPDGEVSHLPGFRSVYDEIADKFASRGVCAEQAAKNAARLVLAELSCGDCGDVVATMRGNVENGNRTVLRIGAAAAHGEVSAVLFAEGPRYSMLQKRKGKLSCYERRKDDEVVAVDLYMAGRSLVALRAAELLTLAAELKRRTGRTPEIVAAGRFAIAVKFAVAADPDAFAAVRFEAEPMSFLESVKARRDLPFAVSGAIFSGKGE